MSKSVVAIDGPAGAGKSTVAQKCAQLLGYTYIDTGAMYRAVAWQTLQRQKPVTDELILSVLPDIDIKLRYAEGRTEVFVGERDVTAAIRLPEVTAIVSQVAALGPVREKLVELQRNMAVGGAVIMDGRDIATHVLPNADLKIYLTASIEERAKRRWSELSTKGLDVDFDKLKDEIARRDKFDSEREISPLRQDKDAILLDTTDLGIDEVVEKILAMCR